MEQATEIPMDDCALTISCGRAGTWLYFEATNGKSAGINVDSMDKGHIIDAALRGWCEDRQKQAEQIRADNGQLGVGVKE